MVASCNPPVKQTDQVHKDVQIKVNGKTNAAANTKKKPSNTFQNAETRKCFIYNNANQVP